MCSKSIFPYNHFDEDDTFSNIIKEQSVVEPRIPFDIINNENQVFNPFEINEESTLPLSDIDPDFQYYNNQCRQNILSCEYYLENGFNEKIKDHKITNSSFSIMHAYVRSASKNLSKLSNYLTNLSHSFSIIALSETWGKDHSVDRYGIDFYNSEHRYRSSHSGGGVSLFIRDSIEYHVRDDLSLQNPFIESLFIEIDKKKCREKV